MKNCFSILLALCSGLTINVHAADLERMLAATGDKETTIEISQPVEVSGNVAVPANVTLRFARGGELRLAGGAVLDYAGGLEAGPFRIFSGEGRVKGHARVETIRPEWFYDGAYDSEDADWSGAIMRALRWAGDGVRHVTLLNRRYNLNSPLLMVPHAKDGGVFHGVTLEGAVRSTQYRLGTLLVGNTGSGKPVIETSDSDGIALKNIGLVRGTRTPSDIGLLQARANRTEWAGDQFHDNLFVDMGSAPEANGGFGTIGVVNIAGEETRYNNLQVWANLPLIISWTGGDSDQRLHQLRRTNPDLKTDTRLVLPSAADLQPVDGHSNTVFALTGLGRLIAYDYVSPVVLINMGGMVDLGHTFLQKRMSAGNEAGSPTGEGHLYALEVWNAFQLRHWGSAEGCHGYLLNRRGLYFAECDVTIAGRGEKNLPAILLLDDGSDDTTDYHTTLYNVECSIFSYDKERPLIQARNLDGKPDPGRFLIRNSVFRSNQPWDDSTKPSSELLARTAGTAWYFSNGLIAPGSREFVQEPIPDRGNTGKTRAKE